MGNKILFEQKNNEPDLSRKYKKWEYKTIYCINDAIFHFLCSIAGFYSLPLANHIFGSENGIKVGN